MTAFFFRFLAILIRLSHLPVFDNIIISSTIYFVNYFLYFFEVFLYFLLTNVLHMVI